MAAFRRRGHEVLVLGPSNGNNSTSSFAAWLFGRLRTAAPGLGVECLELMYNLVAYSRLRKACRRWQPDVLYERYNLFTLAGVWTRRKLDLPYLLEVNAPLAEERARFGTLRLKNLARWSERSTWSGSDFVLPVTRVLADHITAAGVAREKVEVIPNGVNRSRFLGLPALKAAKRSLGLEGRLVLGFVGHVRDWHGLDKAIDFVGKFGDELDLHLVLAGDGPALPELRNRADSLGAAPRISFLGLVPKEKVPAVIAAFDVALQPAVVPYACPLKVLEYMAAGRAIVAPSQPNIREILSHNENACLFDPNIVGHFDNSVLQLCKDRGLRDRVGQAARNTIEQMGLTWDDHVAKIE